MEVIEQIGAYAGLAAIVGLAVLSALYFSQARDVKRLREWAGRAPERAIQPVVQAQRAVAAPQPAQGPPGKPDAAGKPAAPAPAASQPPGAARPPAPPEPAGVPAKGGPPAVPGPPVPAPEPVIAASAGARPATATAATAAATAAAERPGGPAAATPAAQGKPGTVDAPTQVPGAGGDQPRPATPAAQERRAEGSPAPAASGPAAPVPPAGQDAGSAGPPEPETSEDEIVVSETGGTAAGPATAAGQVRPSPPPAPPRLPPRPAPPQARPSVQQTAIIPPGSAAQGGGRTLSRARMATLAVAGVLVLGGGAAFAVSQITGGDDDGQAEQAPGNGDGGTAGGDRRPVDPSQVTVAVLNGTLVPGLAAAIGDELENQGFDLGTLGNTDDQEQQRAESVVLFARGHQREAVAVSRRLKIPQREAIDPDTQALAGDASVVVVAGEDQTP